jgi:hypothetical protein
MPVTLPNLHPYSLWDMMIFRAIPLDSPFPDLGETSGDILRLIANGNPSVSIGTRTPKGEKR